MSHINMQNSRTTLTKDFIEGRFMTLGLADLIWEEHALFFPEGDATYYCAQRRAREIFSKCKIYLVNNCVVLEAVKVAPDLIPVLVRYINFRFQGTKIITTLTEVLFIPDFVTDKDVAHIKGEMLDAYFNIKFKDFSFIDKVSLSFQMFLADIRNKSRAKIYERLFFNEQAMSVAC